MRGIVFYPALFFMAAILINIQLITGENTKFTKQTKIKCQSRVNLKNYSRVKCAVICAQHRTLAGSPCKAFNVTNSVCTLCLIGPVTRTKQAMWTSTKEVFAVDVENFNEELEKGKICSSCC